MSELIPISKIDPNPFQPRRAEDPEATARIAESIRSVTLLQIPSARKVGGRYQLAFGHTRLAAFKLLASQVEGYGEMPLNVVDLTDLQMFEAAVSENIQRRDLNPVEVAQAMRRYMTDFGKTSEECGQFFGMSGATVRGLVRLLDLPENVQKQVACGEISQGDARKLLTISRAADDEQVKEAAQRMTAGETFEDVFEMVTRRSDTIHQMWSSWQDGKPLAGTGLWAIDMKPEKFPMFLLPELTAADVAKVMGMEFTADLRSRIEGYLLDIFRVPNLVDLHPEDTDLIERIDQLARPPACSACPFHAVSDGTHVCGFKPCHQRKRKAWIAQDMQKVSKKLGIPIHDPAADGKAVLPLSEHTYQDQYKRDAELVKAADGDLRIQAHKNEYGLHKWTESNHCRLVLVGKRVTEANQKNVKAKEAAEVNEEKRRLQYVLDAARREAANTFVDEYATLLLGEAFKGMENIPALCALADVKKPKPDAKKADVLKNVRSCLARHALRNLNGFSWELLAKGAGATAKYLQGVATSWGVKLPADFLEVAKGYDPVAAETGKKK